MVMPVFSTASCIDSKTPIGVLTERSFLLTSFKFGFEPVIGETYHLYVGSDGKNFLSLISPNEWNRECLGSFQLTTEQKWIKI